MNITRREIDKGGSKRHIVALRISRVLLLPLSLGVSFCFTRVLTLEKVPANSGFFDPDDLHEKGGSRDKVYSRISFTT